MNPHLTYCLILAISIAGPIALSFDRKVQFYKKWKYLFPAILIPGVLYIVWDIWFTSKGVWGFNENYIIGIKLFNLPLEEAAFFFIVPYCCVFIYECIRCYFPRIKNNRPGNIILISLAILLFITGLCFHEKSYTSWTFILSALVIGAIYHWRTYFAGFKSTLFLVSWLIILVPFLVVNGFLTSIPVVVYTNAENLGIRIFTIPVEDIFYGMLLMLMNIAIYERLTSHHTIPPTL